jgi:glycine oxidase
VNPFRRLRTESRRIIAGWAEEILSDTGIDIGFRRTGGLLLAEPDPESFRALGAELRTETVALEQWDAAALAAREPLLAHGGPALWLPDHGQIRNPRYLKGLIAWGRRLGVEHRPGAEVSLVGRDATVQLKSGESLSAGTVLVAAGAWAGRLLGAIADLPVYPLKGEMLLYRTAPGSVRSVVELGRRYVAPREDGMLLVGSTEEKSGFDKSTTAAGVESLRAFAEEVFPFLMTATLERTWAGLRPACDLGAPILGPLPGMERVWVSAGHFRQGLQLSPGAAELVAAWMTGEATFSRPEDFSLSADRSGARSSLPS